VGLSPWRFGQAVCPLGQSGYHLFVHRGNGVHLLLGAKQLTPSPTTHPTAAPRLGSSVTVAWGRLTVAGILHSAVLVCVVLAAWEARVTITTQYEKMERGVALDPCLEPHCGHPAVGDPSRSLPHGKTLLYGVRSLE
jgi:hypothetical protein